MHRFVPRNPAIDFVLHCKRDHTGKQTTRQTQAGKHTHSEQDWVWVVHELGHGKDAIKLTHTLASQRSAKPNPLYDAQGGRKHGFLPTLGYLKGTAIENAIAMLIAWRHSELPATFCLAVRVRLPIQLSA